MTGGGAPYSTSRSSLWLVVTSPGQPARLSWVRRELGLPVCMEGNCSGTQLPKGEGLGLRDRTDRLGCGGGMAEGWSV